MSLYLSILPFLFFPPLSKPHIMTLTPSAFERSDVLWIIFLSGFFLCSVDVQTCIIGCGKAVFASFQPYFRCGPIPAGVRGLDKGGWTEGEGHQELVDLFKIIKCRPCWRRVHLDGLDFSQDDGAGGAQWLNVFGCHWLPFVQSDWSAMVVWVGRLQSSLSTVNGIMKIMPDRFYVALKNSVCSTDRFQMQQLIHCIRSTLTLPLPCLQWLSLELSCLYQLHCHHRNNKTCSLCSVLMGNISCVKSCTSSSVLVKLTYNKHIWWMWCFRKSPRHTNTQALDSVYTTSELISLPHRNTLQ